MKPKIKIVYSSYYYEEVVKPMLEFSVKNLEVNNFCPEYDDVGVPGCFEIPYYIAKSIKEDTVNIEKEVGLFKGKGKEKIRDNIVQMAKLSQLNLENQCIYSGYLALGCIIKGKTINHQVISTSIFTNLQRISIENLIPIGNGIFNANNIDEAKEKSERCAMQARLVLKTFIEH